MQFFQNYIAKFDIPASEKEQQLEENLLSNHHLYLNLITYLAPAFPKVNQAQIDSLSLGSYLYFRFLLYFDSLIDTPRHEKDKLGDLNQMSIGFEFYEKSIRELSSIYKGDSPFWIYFRKLKADYYKTLVLEKTISKKKGQFSEELFQQIAMGKSSMSFASVYSLEILNGPSVHFNTLQECLKSLHVGLQYIDDIDDFLIDIKQSQWTYPLYLVQEYLKENGLIIHDPSILHKYLYLSGIAQNQIQLAKVQFIKSSSLAEIAGLSCFVQYLEKQIDMCQIYLNEIEQLIHKTKIKSSKSDQFFAENTLEKSKKYALSYLEKNLNDTFEWPDFLTSAGLSTTWTTAYVGMQIAEVNSQHPFLIQVLEKVGRNSTHSFNEKMVQDGDSTNFLVGFHQTSTAVVDKELVEKWLLFMNHDGGWVTYRNEEELRVRLELSKFTSMSGWTAAHSCVTAAAAYVLSTIPSLKPQYEKTCQYLISKLSNKSYWESYWWTSDVYATSFAVLALSAYKDNRGICEKPLNWLISQQHPNGYWINPINERPDALYSALALKALLLANSQANQMSIKKGAEWLMKTQTNDGSWQTNRVLRIPATHIIHPNSKSKWRNSSFGVNTIVDDHNRFFTTSTVLNFLHNYSIHQSL